MNELLWDVWVDICNCVCNVLYCILICISVFQGQIKPLYEINPIETTDVSVIIYTNPQHIDNKLNFDKHTNHIVTKANRVLAMTGTEKPLIIWTKTYLEVYSKDL